MGISFDERGEKKKILLGFVQLLLLLFCYLCYYVEFTIGLIFLVVLKNCLVNIFYRKTNVCKAFWVICVATQHVDQFPVKIILESPVQNHLSSLLALQVKIVLLLKLFDLR